MGLLAMKSWYMMLFDSDGRIIFSMTSSLKPGGNSHPCAFARLRSSSMTAMIKSRTPTFSKSSA
jgi:hypothetical protein